MTEDMKYYLPDAVPSANKKMEFPFGNVYLST